MKLVTANRSARVSSDLIIRLAARLPELVERQRHHQQSDNDKIVLWLPEHGHLTPKANPHKIRASAILFQRAKRRQRGQINGTIGYKNGYQS